MRNITKRVAQALIGIVFCIPFYLLFTLASKKPDDVSSMWKPALYWNINNFLSAWDKAHIGRALINTTLITTCTVILIVLVGSLAAYPLARRPHRLNRFVSMILISCLVVPPLTVLVPLYTFIVDLGGLNTRWAMVLILVTFQLPLSIFLFTNFIKTLPIELDEAATIEGCSSLKVFFLILFPLLKPVTSAIVILCGIQVWNDYQFSLFFLQRSPMHTIAVALSQFVSQYQNDIGLVAAGCLVGILPMTVIYLFLQKYFVRGLSEGAMKG